MDQTTRAMRGIMLAAVALSAVLLCSCAHTGGPARPDGSPMPACGRGPSVDPWADTLEGKTMLPHAVDPTDTLEDIAEMYGSRVGWIKLANPGIQSDADLRRAREILVPVPVEDSRDMWLL